MQARKAGNLQTLWWACIGIGCHARRVDSGHEHRLSRLWHANMEVALLPALTFR